MKWAGEAHPAIQSESRHGTPGAAPADGLAAAGRLPCPQRGNSTCSQMRGKPLERLLHLEEMKL